MHITIKGGMAANQVGVKSKSSVRMVRGANNEGHKGTEHYRFLLFDEVRVDARHGRKYKKEEELAPAGLAPPRNERVPTQGPAHNAAFSVAVKLAAFSTSKNF